VAQDPVLAVPFHRPREHRSLDVGTATPKRVHVIAVRDPDHVLLDDRTGVELLGHVVGGGTDQLPPAPVGLLIGLSAREGACPAGPDR
jgi:hypothetical protein